MGCKLLIKSWNFKNLIYLEGSNCVIRGIYMNGVSLYLKLFFNNGLFKWFLNFICYIDLWCIKYLSEKKVVNIIYEKIIFYGERLFFKLKWYLILDCWYCLCIYLINICECLL